VKKPRNLAHPAGEIRWERFGVPSPNRIRAAQPWPAFSTAVFRMIFLSPHFSYVRHSTVA
jgi:hypothetical protein